MLLIDRNWIVDGYKNDIGNAVDKLMANAAISQTQTDWRRDLLTSFRLVADSNATGNTGNSITVPTFLSASST